MVPNNACYDVKVVILSVSCVVFQIMTEFDSDQLPLGVADGSTNFHFFTETGARISSKQETTRRVVTLKKVMIKTKLKRPRLDTVISLTGHDHDLTAPLPPAPITNVELVVLDSDEDDLTLTQSFSSATDQVAEQSRACVKALKHLKEALMKYSDSTTASTLNTWLGTVDILLARDLPRTVIGVLGSTGVGKSSMLNALLNEASILPTSGSRGKIVHATLIHALR